MPQAALVWFRNDLRVSDNPALSAALHSNRPVSALYVHETDLGLRRRGAASRWWLNRSLQSLGEDLATRGIVLEVVEGSARTALRDTLERRDASEVFFNRRYAPAERELDYAVRRTLETNDIGVHDYNGALLVEPWEIETGKGGPYSVFTPFFAALRQRDIARPLTRPRLREQPIATPNVDKAYRAPNWTAKLDRHWAVGEAAAQAALERFLDRHIADYPEARDFPAKQGTSRLSPHLAFGEISARQVWHAALALAARQPHRTAQVDKFLTELGWREFNYHQLFHRFDIAEEAMNPRGGVRSWRTAPDELAAWQRGQTGIPIVDAGMRELWATGYMENRVRMLVASLLSKNLLIDWRIGEKWFWDTLVDADIANNPGNWQWVAGSGLDAAPWFRVFNPVLQGEKFDAAGAYVRRWVPEISGLPDNSLHAPWAAKPPDLAAAGIVLGKTYPLPIVDLKASRARALAAAKQA